MNDEELGMHRLLGGIASDTKHILARQDLQDVRINGHGSRLNALEKSQGRSAGVNATIAFLVPLALVVAGWFITQ